MTDTEPLAFLGMSTLVFGAPNVKGVATNMMSIRRENIGKYLNIIFLK